ncbi:riboflavin synthase [uncultured Jatrophihabitans sp.]|uniref:riboflavin synthase n=1 Tax=uncultured Jatrophihabitans sp. TaxID=1610747 RepID=UPI0035CA9E88
MFTGIIEQIGEVTEVEHRGDAAVLHLRAAGVAHDLTHGESIAVDGVCLTVVGWQDDTAATRVAFDVMGESLKRSTLGALVAGDRVNLERAVRADARLGGHVVQGHVDGTGAVVSRTPGTEWELVRFGLPRDLAGFVAEKGSIAVDGVSLTVAAVGADWFEVGLIPETLRATTLGAKQAGDPVNLEVDVLAKYVARLMEVRA